MNTTLNNYESSVNRNLSSLLSQIQDDGPAYANNMRQNNSDNIVMNQNTNSDATAPAAASAQQPLKATKAKVAKKVISPGVWLQLLLLLISAAMLVSTLFRLDAQSDDLEKSFTDYEEQLEETISYQNKKVPAGTTKINKKLKLLQNELKTIKTDYQELSNKYVAINTTATLPDAEAEAIKQQNANAYQEEILSLKNELLSVKEKLKTINQQESLNKQAAVISGPIVNLASFTSKYNAEKIVKQLSTQGLLPAIAQAVVNGERVYRLSVSGFSDRKAAESFIREAGERYGMFGSRIKES